MVFLPNAVFKPGVLEQRTRGNCSVGQLTKVGFMQQEKNGDVLRKAYVDSTFLKQNLSASEVYIRSDSECIIENDVAPHDVLQ